MMSRSSHKSTGGWVNRFWFALEYNDQKTINALISQGVNIDHTFKQPGHRRHGQTPIFIAVSKNNKELVNLLLAARCNLEYCNLWGETVFFTAVRQGKIAMVRHLVHAGCNVNHLNTKGENGLFPAIKWGRKDLVEYLKTTGVNVDVVTKDGTTPLLLAMELYENTCNVRHATRRSAPSNMVEIICGLVPCCASLNHQHPNKGSALRIALNVETSHSPDNLHLSRLLMQHGAVPDRLFFLRFGGLHASTSQPGSEFFSVEFFGLALTAGANLQREKTWLLTVLTEMPQELQPYEQLFRDLLDKAMAPASLQTTCTIVIRRLLAGNLWEKIDKLPLPATVKDCLKLKHK